ncbi:MAG: NUDIX hydrolase [Clostridia bacterium]|nr:NUDIX hydrolase [Clostridia bacterium]
MSGYIMDLRKIVGHRPLLQVGASTIVEDRDGRILLQLRSDNGCWGYAGGSVELDEDVEQAARRELFEETGLVARSMELFGVFSGKDTHYVYPNGDEVSNVDIVYICREYDGELCCQRGEVEELKFFSPDEIPDNISKPIEKALRKYVSMRLGKEEKR